MLKGNALEATIASTNNTILKRVTQSSLIISVIDASFNLSKQGIVRKANKETAKRSYRVLPSSLSSMREAAMRATKLNTLITEKRYRIMEVDPTST